MILWELVSRKYPYHSLNEKQVTEKILKNEHDAIPSDAPSGYIELIKSCWQFDPAKRPDLPTIIAKLTAYQLELSDSSEAMRKRGLHYESQNDDVKAFEFYQQSAKAGDPYALTNLGFFYLKGEGGVSVDKKLAHQHFLEAAEKGHARAMYNLAQMLKYGDGIPKDLESARDWYKKAADKGDEKAAKKYQELLVELNSNLSDNYNQSTLTKK